MKTIKNCLNPVFILILLALDGCTNSSIKSNLSLADKNLIDANKFLSENRKIPGVVQTSSGLQYKQIKNGSGCHPNPNAPVIVHYESRLVGSDTTFDSSYQRKIPGTFDLKRMILAWEEGIPLMQEGAIWEFYAPPNLAYGENGAPPVIEPNVVTIYKVELIKAKQCNP